MINTHFRSLKGTVKVNAHFLLLLDLSEITVTVVKCTSQLTYLQQCSDFTKCPVDITESCQEGWYYRLLTIPLPVDPNSRCSGLAHVSATKQKLSEPHETWLHVHPEVKSSKRKPNWSWSTRTATVYTATPAFNIGDLASTLVLRLKLSAGVLQILLLPELDTETFSL